MRRTLPTRHPRLPSPARAVPAFAFALLALSAGTSAWGQGAVITIGAAPLAAESGGGESGLARIAVGPALDLVGNPVDMAAIIRAQALAQALANAVAAGQAMPIPGLMPVSGRYVTSGFGLRAHPLLGGQRLHAGVDLAAPLGSPVHATTDGVVGWAGARGGYGLLVGVAGAAGVETRYAHLSRLNVASGQTVRRGQVLGWSGSTGLSTGPHLHYEIRVNGRAVNPLGR